MQGAAAVFISGQGSNLRSLLECSDFQVALVVTSNPKAKGLRWARFQGVPIVHFSTKKGSELDRSLKRYRIEFIVLAGFMKVLSVDFVNQWDKKMINIHPSLLPHFKGLNSIEKAFKSEGPYGITVHEVEPEVDSGPSLMQKKINPMTNWELNDLEFYYHICEQKLLRESAKKWIERKKL